MLDAAHCYEALKAKDARFDGVFFVGVSSTGIYCRPVCPVRTPRRDRCTFHPSAASAEASGFRPCLRCRPELAPGHASIDATARIARAALSRIEAGALSDGSVDDLAAELGVGARQLRRAIERELGVTPTALAQTHRLLLAKQLLTDTRLRVVDVAFASGFSSVRQFNRTFKQRYRMSPSTLRKSRAAASPADAIVLKLGFRPPLAWDALTGFLIARAAPCVERLVDGSYVRTVAIGEDRGWISARPDIARKNLVIEVSTSLTPVLPALLARLRRLFDTSANPTVIDDHLRRDPRIAAMAKKRPGLRVPGTLDGFELALRAIIGQQISVKAATTVYTRLVAAFGVAIATPVAGLDRTAPRAADIAAAAAADLLALGLTGRRAKTVALLASAMASGELHLDPSTDPADARRQLLALPGVGPWTAEYIAMRALADPDAMPTSDLGLLRAADLRDPAALEARAESWRPWRAYASLHLWSSLAPAPEETP